MLHVFDQKYSINITIVKLYCNFSIWINFEVQFNYEAKLNFLHYMVLQKSFWYADSLLSM